MPMALAAEGVCKSYLRNRPWALENVSLEVPQGAVLALLGPHGAGKTTLLKLWLGVLLPTRGRVRVLDTEDLETVRERIGYVPQRADYHPHFTAREYLHWLGRIRGKPREHLESHISRLLERVGLSSQAEARLATYSRGQLQRVGLAQALLSEPEVLLLDEPETSPDPEDQIAWESLVQEQQAQGKTCLLASHNLEETARLATHAALLKEGHLVDFREWPPESLAHTFSLSVPPLSPPLQQALAEWSVTYDAESGELLATSPTDQLPEAFLQMLLKHGVPVRAITPQGPSWPEVYRTILQEGLDHEGAKKHEDTKHEDTKHEDTKGEEDAKRPDYTANGP